MSDTLLRPAVHLPSADDDASIFRLVRGVVRNPLSMYSPKYFRDPVVSQKLGRRRFTQIMDPEMAKSVLQDTGTFGRSRIFLNLLGEPLGDGLLTAEGESWMKQRRAAAPAFRQKALDSLVPTFSGAGDRMADRLAARAGETVDVADEATRATFEVIAETLLQREHGGDEEADRMADDVELFLRTIGRVSLHDIFPALNYVFPRRLFVRDYAEGHRASDRTRAYAAKVVEERMGSGKTSEHDLMGLLINAEDPKSGESLTPEQLVDNALTFIGAGHETTAAALSWTAYLLAQSPELERALHDEVCEVVGDGQVRAEHIEKLTLTDRVLQEAMRLFPPVPIIPRQVRSDTELNGVTFEEGDFVAIAVYAMHRHQRLWENPDAFDPDRFLEERSEGHHRYQYLPFGGGPRICIGLRFAVMEGVALLASLMRKVRFERTDAPLPEPYLAVTMRPRDGMPLRIARR